MKKVESLLNHNTNNKIILIELCAKVLFLRGRVLSDFDFLHKPLPDQYPYMWFRFDPIVDANARVQRKCLPNLYPRTIQTNRQCCISLYTEIAMSRQSALKADHFSSQIPIRAISCCFGSS